MSCKHFEALFFHSNEIYIKNTDLSISNLKTGDNVYKMNLCEIVASWSSSNLSLGCGSSCDHAGISQSPLLDLSILTAHLMCECDIFPLFLGTLNCLQVNV